LLGKYRGLQQRHKNIVENIKESDEQGRFWISSREYSKIFKLIQKTKNIISGQKETKGDIRRYKKT
jgi:predicted nucleic acid-binding protein